jgi:uncharacterized protein YceH (UPF0502 family)
VRRFGFVLLVACTHADVAVRADAGAVVPPMPVDAALDLAAVQAALGKRVDHADREATVLRGAAAPAARTRPLAAALGAVEVTGAAAKQQIALLETPAASAQDAEASVAAFEKAVAALAASIDAK